MARGVAAAKKGDARCALCEGAAAVHCAADAAFLCARCDARVHGANFLASRHVRRSLRAEGAVSRMSDASTASSGSCVSTADSAAVTGAGRDRKQRRQRRPRAEAVLEGWAKQMGLAPGAARRRANAAACTLRAVGRGVAAARVPLRVAMAAALWSELSATAGYGGGGKAALLCKLEATAHVPARLVLTVASWMAQERHRPAPAVDAEEGWAECC